MILSKSQLVDNINREISDQSSGQISPYDIRHNLIDVIDSVHNLLLTHDINGLNLGTPSTRNVRLGEDTLKNLSLPLALSEDNTAIGFNALRSNYQGVKNIAVGSYALSCNVYGSGNIAIGYSSLVGNTVGHSNIGIGSYALHNSKGGQNNVAIGRGAGYYISKSDNNKLFIGSHSVDAEYICVNPSGTGLFPLVYGDFATQQLGINVKSFHSNSTLQVSGNITPAYTDEHNLGINGYRWKFLNLSSGTYYGNDLYIGRGFSVDGIAISGNIIPVLNNIYSIGSQNNSWASGFFNDITVTGTAYINNLTHITENYTTNKNLYIALDSNGDGYLTDEEIVNGGFGIKSSTDNYHILFSPESSGLDCFSGKHNKSTWTSNISFQIPSGGYIRVNSVVSYENNDNCYGLYFSSGITYLSRKNILSVDPGSENGHLAGIGSFNILANSGDLSNHIISLAAIESGVSVSQRFLSGAKKREKDLSNNDKDKLQGFEIKYIDDSLSESQGFLSDRLVIGSYNNTSEFVNGFTIMKDSEDGSVVGITNISSITEDILPETILNIRSDNEAVVRITAETSAYQKSALQLLAANNCEVSGLELAYLNNSGVADIYMYDGDAKTNFIRFNSGSGNIGILSSGIANEAITIGHSGISGLPVLSLKDSRWVEHLQNNIVASSGYAKIYNLFNVKDYADQVNDLKFLDSSGNIFDLIVNKYDNLDARAIYVDTSGNTFGGYLSPSGRTEITQAVSGNTSYGYQSLYSITSGSGNIGIGFNAMSGIKYGNDNIVIGNNSFNTCDSGNKNIVIGNRSFIRPNSGSTSGNIVIGNDGVGNAASGSYHFLLGSNEKTILLHGTLGPNNSDKKLVMPSGGRIFFNNSNDTESLSIRNNVIEIIDSGGSNYPENELTFKFTGNQSADLLKLSHTGIPLSNVATYSSENRPFAELNGDLKLRGNISFNDGTSLGSSSFLDRVDELETNLSNLVVEGYAISDISPPSSSSSPTTGQIRLKNASWQDTELVTIKNRDTTCVIKTNDYVIAIKVNNEYRPIWINAVDTLGSCCVN